jgi:hypothetical protein
VVVSGVTPVILHFAQELQRLLPLRAFPATTDRCGGDGNAGGDCRRARKADGGEGVAGGIAAMFVRRTAVMSALVVIAVVLVRPTAVMAPKVGSPQCS